VEAKFLAYVLTVTQRFVMRAISYANALFVICIELLQLAMDGNYRRCYAVEGTVRHREGRGKLFRFPTNPGRYVHKIIEQMYNPLFMCHTTHFRCQT
jgi:hypothetical protein